MSHGNLQKLFGCFFFFLTEMLLYECSEELKLFLVKPMISKHKNKRSICLYIELPQTHVLKRLIISLKKLFIFHACKVFSEGHKGILDFYA